MSINKNVKRNFLYYKEEFHKVGMLIDSDEDIWYELAEEWKQLRTILMESDIGTLLCELVYIFKAGTPNFRRLSELFSRQYSLVQGGLIAKLGLEEAHRQREEYEERFGKEQVGMDHGDKIICRVENIDRRLKDLTKIEMDVDVDCLKINDLYLFVTNLPDVNELQTNLKARFNDIEISITDTFEITDETYKIIILKDEEKVK
ncbi:hypothetical protein EJP77_09430 [Paenibacillus zeisoli]|uniref:Uncharacterized protein n=1 Tax=Paenibacillus zeisoli TaxID=2496267 RepID=A0A3S1B7I0_9BACL|nr:hypothetical protein [Paenibacillus zeisoli]RUT31607.1 hypothetical protein EJP77_09430 [Paenibacillus zeisoli]